MKVSFEVAYKAWLAGRSVRLMYEGARPRDSEETRKYRTGIVHPLRMGMAVFHEQATNLLPRIDLR